MKGLSGIVLGAENSKVDGLDSQYTNENDSLQLADDEVILNLIGKSTTRNMKNLKKKFSDISKAGQWSLGPIYRQNNRAWSLPSLSGCNERKQIRGLRSATMPLANDCHNYWGYRGPENTTASGYSCFSSPEQAIQVVGKKSRSLLPRAFPIPLK